MTNETLNFEQLLAKLDRKENPTITNTERNALVLAAIKVLSQQINELNLHATYHFSNSEEMKKARDLVKEAVAFTEAGIQKYSTEPQTEWFYTGDAAAFGVIE